MLEEESIVMWRRFLSGDNAAYCWLYNEYVQILFRYGSRFTPDCEQVKDCIQDLFTTLYKNRKCLGPPPSNVKVYLFVSLKNNLLRALTKQSRFEQVEQGMSSFILEPTVEEQFIDNESDLNRQHLIQKILSVLTPRQKEIVYYRYIQELEFEEICMLMQLNYQSAQNLLQRSIKKIRNMFPPDTYNIHY
jgi:RNA polymerase sigma factor (sigma-70 family)